MGLNDGLIGVVIPTYGRRASLLATIEMLKAQTWQRWRAVIMDQNPEAVPFPTDNRIDVIWKPDEPSLYKSRNGGMEYLISQGASYLCFWDDDDLVVPEYMAKMVAPFLADARVSLTCCRIWAGKALLPRGFTSTPCRMVRADVIDDRRWVQDDPKVEKVWWPQFDGLPLAYVDETLVTTGDNPIGGVRHRRATY